MNICAFFVFQIKTERAVASLACRIPRYVVAHVPVGEPCQRRRAVSIFQVRGVRSSVDLGADRSHSRTSVSPTGGGRLLQRLGRQKPTREPLPQQGVPGMGMASAADAAPPFGAQPSHGRRFFLIVFIFGGAQIFLVALGWVAVHAIDITRAYATGESLYSKAHNVVVLILCRYAHAGETADLAAFRASIAVTQGDRAAREALERPEPDREAAFAGFRHGGT